jgi:voltage-gated potassium channel
VTLPFRVRRSWVLPGLLAGLVLTVAAGGAIASLEAGTASSFGQGLWWAISLMTTVGFIGRPPTTVAGAALSVVLMLSGFLLLALVSAAFASLFVREDIEPVEERELSVDEQILRRLDDLHARLDTLDDRLTRLTDTRGDGEPG